MSSVAPFSIEQLLNRLDRVRPKTGGGYTARCPAHEDRSPSLSIDEKDGTILLHCFAGCTTEAICLALGIELAQLTAPKIRAAYDYVDENGAVLFQVVRFEPKDFRQRRPDGKGGWIWSLAGVRRVLYRLPEVLRASVVYVVEGEKDADTIQSLGLVGTSNAGGAGKWHKEYSECLRGKIVVVIADADKPGREHAQAVAGSLHLIAAEVKVLEVPDAKDVSEWIARGGTAAQLAELVASTPAWTEAARPSRFRGLGFNGRVPYPVMNFLGVEFPRPEFLVEGLIPRNGTAMIFSMPHHLKSYFTTALALAATTAGENKLGRLTVPKPVRTLLVQMEDFPGELQARIKMLIPYLDVDPGNLFVIARVDHRGKPIEIYFPDDDSKHLMVEEIEANAIELVIFDVARRIAHIDLNSPKESAEFLDQVDELRYARSRPAIALVHHENRKEADIMYASAGSYNLPGWAQTMVHFKRKTESGEGVNKVCRVEIEFDSKLSASLDPMTMTLDLHSDRPVLLTALEESGSLAELREQLGTYWSIRDFMEVQNISSRSNAQRRLTKLTAAGIVEKVSGGKGGRGGVGYGQARYHFVGEPE